MTLPTYFSWNWEIFYNKKFQSDVVYFIVDVLTYRKIQHKQKLN